MSPHARLPAPIHMQNWHSLTSMSSQTFWVPDNHLAHGLRYPHSAACRRACNAALVSKARRRARARQARQGRITSTATVREACKPRGARLFQARKGVIRGVPGGEVGLLWVHPADEEPVQAPHVILVRSGKVHAVACRQLGKASLHRNQSIPSERWGEETGPRSSAQLAWLSTMDSLSACTTSSHNTCRTS